jgi:hypothetical protein
MNYYWLHPGMRSWKWNGEREKSAISPYDPIDDGWTHHDCVFVCLDCLKAFHPHRRNGTLKICPECRKPVYSVGPYFAAPSRKTNRGRKAWENIIAAIERREKFCVLHRSSHL